MNWSGLERRKFPRVNYPCMIVIRHGHTAEPQALLTHTENVGIGGVCVVLKNAIKLFTTVEVELDLMDTTHNIKCAGRVVWSVQRRSSEKAKPAFYDTGIEFVNLSANDQKHIEATVARLVKAGQEAPYK